MLELPLIFTSKDVAYLVSLGEAQIKTELAAPGIREAVRMSNWPEYLGQNNYFWLEYRRACLLASEIIDSVKPRRAYTAEFTNRRHSKVDVDEIKNRANIVAIAETYTKLYKTGGTFTGLCPLHSEKHGSFVVHPDRQTWHCYGACNKGGDVISLVMAVESVDFKTAIQRLGG